MYRIRHKQSLQLPVILRNQLLQIVTVGINHVRMFGKYSSNFRGLIRILTVHQFETVKLKSKQQRSTRKNIFVSSNVLMKKLFVRGIGVLSGYCLKPVQQVELSTSGYSYQHIQVSWAHQLEFSLNNRIQASVDGVDFRINRKRPFDPRWFSNKFKGPGLRHEVRVSFSRIWIV